MQRSQLLTCRNDRDLRVALGVQVRGDLKGDDDERTQILPEKSISNTTFW